MYVAAIRQKVDGEWREPGEFVPEAAEWKNLTAYLSSGRILQASSIEEAATIIARMRGVDVDTINLHDLQGEEERTRLARRNMLAGARTGGSLAPMADGSLREPLEGPILERIMAQRGEPLPNTMMPSFTDAQLKAEATAAMERANGGEDRRLSAGRVEDGHEARAQAAHDEADRIREAIEDATGNEGTVPSEIVEASTVAEQESVDRQDAEVARANSPEHLNRLGEVRTGGDDQPEREGVEADPVVTKPAEGETEDAEKDAGEGSSEERVRRVPRRRNGGGNG